MNKSLQSYARAQLKEMLAKCTEGQQHFFKRMYSHQNLELDINDVVDNMPDEKLDWAMHQCQMTLKKADKPCTPGKL